MWVGIKNGVRKNFSSEKDALAFEGQKQATLKVEEPVHEEKAHSKEATGTDEQKAVFESEGGSEEEVQGIPVSIRKWMASKDI